MKNTKIITHNGVFHADEVFAVAILERFIGGNTEIIRTRDKSIIEVAKNNVNDFVIDVGEAYNADSNNFDHHQNSDLPSSAGLIFDRFNNLSKNAKKRLDVSLLSFIDAVDRNKGG